MLILWLFNLLMINRRRRVNLIAKGDLLAQSTNMTMRRAFC